MLMLSLWPHSEITQVRSARGGVSLTALRTEEEGVARLRIDGRAGELNLARHDPFEGQNKFLCGPEDFLLEKPLVELLRRA